MEEFVFVDIGEINKAKAEYLNLHYRYVVIAPKNVWEQGRKYLTDEKAIGGVYFASRRTFRFEYIKNISTGFDFLRKEDLI